MEHRSAGGAANARADDSVSATTTAFARTAPPNSAQGRWAQEKIDTFRNSASSDVRTRHCRGAATPIDRA
jgi:hypothetical protein